MEQPTETPREGIFSIAMGQIGLSLGDVWRGKWTVLKMGLLMIFISALIEMVAIIISPGASFQDYIDDFQTEILDEFEVGIDIRGDDYSVDKTMYDIAKRIEDSDAEQAEKQEELEGADEPFEEFNFKDAIREGIEEDGRIGPNPVDAPIYALISTLGNFALYFVQYIIVIFAVSQTVFNKRQVTMGECFEAVRTCPIYFYTAAIKKMLWILGPALLILVPTIIGFSIAEAGGDSAILKGIITLFATVGGLVCVIWMIRRIMAYMYIEFYALFHEMRFAQAKEASTSIMEGNKNGLFWAWMIVAIAFSMVFGFATVLGLLLFIIPTAALGVVAKWTAIIIGAIGFIFFIAIIQIAPTYFFISWMYRIWQLLLGREGAGVQ